VTSKVTLDLRVAVDENPKDIIAKLNSVIGSEFELKPLMGPEELDAKVRRLNSNSPLFVAPSSPSTTFTEKRRRCFSATPPPATTPAS
jgi:hypothetical protein